MLQFFNYGIPHARLLVENDRLQARILYETSDLVLRRVIMAVDNKYVCLVRRLVLRRRSNVCRHYLIV